MPSTGYAREMGLSQKFAIQRLGRISLCVTLCFCLLAASVRAETPLEPATPTPGPDTPAETDHLSLRELIKETLGEVHSDRDERKRLKDEEYRANKRRKRLIVPCSMAIIALVVGNGLVRSRSGHYFPNGGVRVVDSVEYDQKHLTNYQTVQNNRLVSYLDESGRFTPALEEDLHLLGAVLRQRLKDDSIGGIWPILVASGQDVTEQEVQRALSGDPEALEAIDKQLGKAILFQVLEAQKYTAPELFEKMTLGTFFVDILLPIARPSSGLSSQL